MIFKEKMRECGAKFQSKNSKLKFEKKSRIGNNQSALICTF